MDTYGFLLILAGLILWYFVRARSRGWWWLAGAVVGTGAGIVLGALGVYLILVARLR